MGFNKNISKNKEIEINFSYLNNADISWIFNDVNNPVFFSNKSLSFAVNQFLGNKENKKIIPFFQYGIEVSSITGETSIDLSKLNYKLGGANITCSTCGNLIFKANQNEINFIPFFSIGLRRNIAKRSALDFNLGIQYFKIRNISWHTDMKYNPPKFVNDKIDELVSETDELIFYPRISLKYTFKF